jgi:fatty-acyl-CoA synthase
MIATRLARAAPMRAAIRLLSGERPVNSFPKTAANYRELTPLSYVERAAVVFDDSPAVVDGDATRTWAETFARCCGLGDALRREGCGRGDVVQVMLDNTAEMVEAQHGVPMSGATLGCVNTRLDAATVAYVLEHSEARVLVADARYAGTYGPALAALANPPRLVVVGGPGATYEAFVASGDAGSGFVRPRDEWDALAVNYTSGTTGRPKGVVLHHRGAYILALSNAVDFGGLGGDGTCRYLWTLPMRRPAPRDGRLPSFF